MHFCVNIAIFFVYFITHLSFEATFAGQKVELN